MLYAFPVSQNVSFLCFFTSGNVTFSKVPSVRGACGGWGGAGRAERGLAVAPGLSCPTVIRHSCATAEPRPTLSGSPAPVRCVVPITQAPTGNSTWLPVASVSDTCHTVGERNLRNFAT